MSKITNVYERYHVSNAKTELNLNLMDGSFSSGTLVLSIGTLHLDENTYSEICILIDKMRKEL